MSEQLSWKLSNTIFYVKAKILSTMANKALQQNNS